MDVGCWGDTNLLHSEVWVQAPTSALTTASLDAFSSCPSFCGMTRLGMGNAGFAHRVVP